MPPSSSFITSSHLIVFIFLWIITTCILDFEWTHMQSHRLLNVTTMGIKCRALTKSWIQFCPNYKVKTTSNRIGIIFTSFPKTLSPYTPSYCVRDNLEWLWESLWSSLHSPYTDNLFVNWSLWFWCDDIDMIFHKIVHLVIVVKTWDSIWLTMTYIEAKKKCYWALILVA